MSRCVERCLFTAWTTVREVLPWGVVVMTRVRWCVFCRRIEDMRYEPAGEMNGVGGCMSLVLRRHG